MIQTALCPECRTPMVEDPGSAGNRLHCPKCRRFFRLQGNGGILPDSPGTDTQDRLATQDLPGSGSDDDEQDAIGTQPLDEGTDQASEQTEDVYDLAPMQHEKPVHGKLGRFELRKILGQGRFGTVYQGYDPVLERLVAIKVPKLASQSPEELKRFLAEAKAAARLRHPNIVAVFDTGIADNAAFIAAEFVEGVPLSVRIASNRPDLRLAARWVRDLALALAYAHEEGIVHRDVKPANILIDQKGRPLLTDFGLAMRVGAAAKEGNIAGTPAYMAPEQARGDAANIGPASDQYALGVILYELMTGKRPFDGSTPVVLHKVLHAKPARPRERNRKIPADLESVCLRAMSKKPARRYPNLAEFAQDLQRWINHEPVRARAGTGWENAMLWVRRYRNWVIAASIAGAGILLALAAWSFVGAIQVKKELDIAKAEAQIKLEEQKRIEQLAAAEQIRKDELAAVDKELREKRWLESADLRRRGISRCQEQRIDEGLILLAEALEVAAKADDALAEEVRIELAHWERQVLRLRLMRPKGEEVLALGPDCRIAVVRQEVQEQGQPPKAVIRLLDLAGGQVIGEPLGEDADIRVFSPDSKLMMTAKRQGIPPSLRIWDMSTGRPVGEPIRFEVPMESLVAWAGGLLSPAAARAKPELQLLDAAFSPDGRVFLTACRIVVGSARTFALRLWDTASRQPIGQQVFCRAAAAYPQLFAFSPDSQFIAVQLEADGIQIYDSREFRPIGSVLRQEYSAQTLRFVASTGLLVVQTGDDPFARPADRSPAVPRVAIWDVRHRQATTPEPVSPPIRRSEYPGFKAISPDGRRLLTAEGDRALQLWDSQTGRPVGPEIPCASVSSAMPRFSPDGAWLILFDRPKMESFARLYDARTGLLAGQPLRHRDMGYVQFSADGQSLAFLNEDAALQIWQLGRRRPLTLRREGSAQYSLWPNIESFSFNPDGTRIVAQSLDWNLSSLTWDAVTGEAIPDPARTPANFGKDRAQGLAVSPDGSRCLVQDSAKKTVQLRKTATYEPIGPPVSYKNLGQRAGFSRDCRRAYFCHDEEVTVIDATSDPVRVHSLLHEQSVGSVAVSPDGQMIATSGSRRDGTTRIWNTATGQLIHGNLNHYHLLSFAKPDDIFVR